MKDLRNAVANMFNMFGYGDSGSVGTERPLYPEPGGINDEGRASLMHGRSGALYRARLVLEAANASKTRHEGIRAENPTMVMTKRAGPEVVAMENAASALVKNADDENADERLAPALTQAFTAAEAHARAGGKMRGGRKRRTRAKATRRKRRTKAKARAKAKATKRRRKMLSKKRA